MVSGGAVQRYAFDSSRLVFVADKEVLGRHELYSVPVAGGTPVKLHPPLVAGGDVAIDWEVAPRITSDGTRVVYVADQATDGYDNLYVVPIGGGASVPVGGAGSLGGSRILDFEISPDGEWVAMVQELESFVPGGGISTRLRMARFDRPGWTTVDSCTGECEVEIDPVFSPTASYRIFYVADQDVDEKRELYAGDACVLCDGFEVGSTIRWSTALP